MTRQALTDAEGEAAIDMGPLPDLLGYAIRRAQIAIFQDFHDTFAAIDLRPAEFSVLLIVQRNPGLRQRRLAEVLAILPPNMVGLVGRLAARDLIERRANPDDRRAAALHLTASGERCVRHALRLLDEHESRVTAHLADAERRGLLRQLTKLAASIPRR